jgi:glycosyltransferase involved in cell wall biosynthesis
MHIVCTVTNDLVTDQRMQRICSTLADSGYEVTLIGRILSSSPKLSNQNFKQVRLRCLFNRGFLFYAEYNIRLLIWLLWHKFDIVNAIDLDTIAPAWLSGRVKRKQVVYDAHEWFPECPEIVSRPRIYAFWNKMEQFFVPKMDAVYTVSSAIAQVLQDKYGKEVGLVRNMPVQSPVQASPSKSYLLYQGALNIGRGLPELIAAMKFTDRQLWIAGAGDIEAELKALVKKEKLESKVKFLGRLQPLDLKRITEQAWLGINLLENLGYNYYYSLANKFFDYVQAGVPQLCVDFPEYRAMCKEFPVAELIADIRPEMIAIAIRRLEKHQEEYDALRMACQIASKEWVWERESINLLKVYEQLGR